MYLYYNVGMNKLALLTITTFSILSLTSCNSSNDVSPSQNKALNGVTQATTYKEDGAMQKSLDNWLNKEWTPTVEKDEKIKKINKDKNRNFTLQEYVDKAAVYSKEDNSSTGRSHLKEMNSLPVIGKKR